MVDKAGRRILLILFTKSDAEMKEAPFLLADAQFKNKKLQHEIDHVRNRSTNILYSRSYKKAFV